MTGWGGSTAVRSTPLVATHDGVRARVSLPTNATGCRMALEKLAALVRKSATR